MSDKAKKKAPIVRLVNPDKIVTVEDWATAYKRKNRNIVMSSDGELWVLDPNEPITEASEPVKTIPHLHGYDCLNALNSKTVTEELRAAAETKLTTINDEIKARVEGAKIEYVNAENELLTAVENWKSTADPATRKINAEAVASANAKVAEANEKMRMAAYPERLIVSYHTVPYKLIIADTKDEGSIPTIYSWLPGRTNAKDRIVGGVAVESE